jgi:DNA-binding LacI/PurR family transcriptional regulator
MKPKWRRRMTINNLADLAGVSVSTVSRVLNNKPDVSPETRERVLAIAAEAGYTPSALARSLVTQRTHIVGLGARTSSDQWWAEVVTSIEQVMHEAGFKVFLSNHYMEAARERAVVETFRSWQVDGIIVVTSVLAAEYSAPRVQRGIPIVLIHPLRETDHHYVIQADDVQGAHQATSYLIRLGHRRIGHVGLPSEYLPGRDRLEGYRQALEAAGLAYDPSLVVLGSSPEKGGETGMERLLSLPKPPTAVFCFNDLLAIDALRRARTMGRRVPDDVSVIGYDDIALARYVEPALSTVRQDTAALGRRAALMLLDLIAGRETGAPIRVETQLVERESTGPPPGPAGTPKKGGTIVP